MTLPLIHKSALGVNGRGTERPYMQQGEQEVLLALVFSVRPRTFVEIGVNIGLTAQAVLREIASIEHYTGVDIGADYPFEIPAQETERPDVPGQLVRHDPRFRFVLRGDAMPTSADVVFIDGDHGRHAVAQDSRWAAEVVTPGGLIVWHDYGNPTVEVTQVLDALQAEGRILRHVAGTWLAFEHR